MASATHLAGALNQCQASVAAGRSVVVAIAINDVSVRTLANDLDTTPGAIYKTLHDARVKLRVQLESKLNGRRVGDRVPASKEAAWTCA